ncbi:MAG: hypothetical protein KC503_37505, partial [Myxococcales bacterium]|nr:hypothetical protein [Myxococcales bacterium]
MRRYLVFALLVLMGVSFVMSVSTRPRAAHRVPAAQSRSGSGNGSGNGSGSAASKAKPGSKPTDKARPAKAVKKIARPLRLVCLRWAPCAPAIVANGGVRTAKGSLYAARGLDVRVGARVDIKDIERALGAGGGKADGADIAIVPLSELVAAHERLRALAPRVVLLTGWSHGDVALIARTPAAARAALRPYARGRVTLSGAPGRSATLLSLFTLDLAGVAPERVALVGASTRSAA